MFQIEDRGDRIFFVINILIYCYLLISLSECDNRVFYEKNVVEKLDFMI